MTLTSTARRLRRNQTDAEKKLWNHLRSRQLGGFKFYRQYPVYPYYVDFLCREPKLIIELDGGKHNEDPAIIYDEKRTHLLESKGYRVIRFWNNDVLQNTQGVLKVIAENLSLTFPPAAGPFLSLKGEES